MSETEAEKRRKRWVEESLKFTTEALVNQLFDETSRRHELEVELDKRNAQLEDLREALSNLDAAKLDIDDDAATLGRAVVALVDAEDTVIVAARALVEDTNE